MAASVRGCPLVTSGHEGKMGWPMGLEPTTFGATIQWRPARKRPDRETLRDTIAVHAPVLRLSSRTCCASDSGATCA
jgi:hypothetical protein